MVVSERKYTVSQYALHWIRMHLACMFNCPLSTGIIIRNNKKRAQFIVTYYETVSRINNKIKTMLSTILFDHLELHHEIKDSSQWKIQCKKTRIYKKL